MKKILIIEDDENITLSMVIRLEAEGYAVTTAVDAINAVEAVKRDRPDLMLVDIAIPAGGGFSVVEQVREMPEVSNTPFIFVTASQVPGVRERGIELGAHAFLQKPYDYASLKLAIESALTQEHPASSATEP